MQVPSTLASLMILPLSLLSCLPRAGVLMWAYHVWPAAAGPSAAGWEGSSSQHGRHKCQIVVHQAGTVVRCWFIPDVYVVGKRGKRASKWSYTGCSNRTPTRFRLADDSRENGWSIGAVVSSLCHIVMIIIVYSHTSNTGWCSGIMVRMLISIDKVNLRWDRLVLRWSTVSGFNSRCWRFISVCNQPATQGQLGLPTIRDQ